MHTVDAATDLIQTATRLAQKDIPGAPVLDRDGIVVGVISEKDFLRKMGADQRGSFLLIIALLVSNPAPNRRYPEFWI